MEGADVITDDEDEFEQSSDRSNNYDLRNPPNMFKESVVSSQM